MLSDDERRQLDEAGYVVFPGLMSPALLDALRHRVDELFEEEGERAGCEFRQEPGAKRLANLVRKGRVFEEVILTGKVLECVGHVIGPEFKLSSLNARAADPKGDSPQPFHCDAGAIADDRGYWVCNSIWMLDDFTPENGATRAIPGSHRWRRLPPAEMRGAHPDERLITGPAGTVAVMNAHLWHGGTANRTDGPRRAVHAFYTRRDKAQQQYQKKWISAEVQARLSPEARWILALDDPLNDELSSIGAGRSGFMK